MDAIRHEVTGLAFTHIQTANKDKGSGCQKGGTAITITKSLLIDDYYSRTEGIKRYYDASRRSVKPKL